MSACFVYRNIQTNTLTAVVAANPTVAKVGINQQHGSTDNFRFVACIDDIIQVNGNDTVDCESRIIEDVSDLTDVQVA